MLNLPKNILHCIKKAHINVLIFFTLLLLSTFTPYVQAFKFLDKIALLEELETVYLTQLPLSGDSTHGIFKEKLNTLALFIANNQNECLRDQLIRAWKKNGTCTDACTTHVEYSSLLDIMQADNHSLHTIEQKPVTLVISLLSHINWPLLFTQEDEETFRSAHTIRTQLEEVFHLLSRSSVPRVRNTLIKCAEENYSLDMSRASNPNSHDADRYPTFNSLLIRDATPITYSYGNNQQMSFYLDGELEFSGTISDDNFNATIRGEQYTLSELLGTQDPRTIQQYLHGSYYIIALTPKHSHQVIMPCSGEIKQVSIIPPFSLQSTFSTRYQRKRNKRVIYHFMANNTQPFLMTLIGNEADESIKPVLQQRYTFYTDELNVFKVFKKTSTKKNGDFITNINSGMGTVVILLPPDPTP